ncbi:MAG TPA: hypothetical protein P5118_23420, partial [Planctomycetota bacterium]|nr:hypothetical protein [Planctomycetota bacterium]
MRKSRSGRAEVKERAAAGRWLRDRVVELVRLPASELLRNPRNWRQHPREQREAMEGIFAEVGVAGAALARRLADGRIELIDGEL